MFVSDYISKDYPAFYTSDLIDEANEVAKDFGFSHVFIKKRGLYIGALSQAFLEDSPEGALGTLDVHYEKFALSEDASLLDSVKLFYTFNTNVIPVVDKEDKYLGYFSRDDIFAEFSKYPLFSENGALITIQTNNTFYSFTEISKIIESQNSKIYGCFVSKVLEDAVQVSLKVSAGNLQSINETFERFGYKVISNYLDTDREHQLKERFNFFNKYLEI